MAKHTFGIAGIVLAAFVIVAFGIEHTSASIADKMYLILNMLFAALIVVLAALVALYAHYGRHLTVRNYSLLISVVCAMVAIVPTAIGKCRINATETALTEMYSRLAENGPPFPTAEGFHPIVAEFPASISHGYWVSTDRCNFELYYHVASDSYALRYPIGRWEWRGFDYTGPDTKP